MNPSNLPIKRKNKFNNQICESDDGHKFRSLMERARYYELLLLEKAGKIKDLKLQVRYKLEVNDILICTYVSDFNYLELALGWVQRVEDCKGTRTLLYKVKRQLMLALFNIRIYETQPKRGKNERRKT